MKRPRIALWIKWHANPVVLWGQRPFRWCPLWLRRWAVRRVDRWHEHQRVLAAANWKLVGLLMEAAEPFVGEGF